MSGENGGKSLLSLDEVLEATGGVHVLGSGEFYITGVQTDSRNVTDGTLFVPLLGEKQDGHDYIPQALEKGASSVFIAMSSYEKRPDYFTGISQSNPDVIFIAVENTMHALQKAAARYVEHFPDLIRIGVTGSSGKTTAKEILASILSQKYNVVTNPGNLNSETGLPLSVFAIREGHKVGLFEMGMNRRNEMAEIASVLKPRFALVTNIGTAHIGILGSRQAIAEEKAHVFDYFNSFGTAFIPRDDDFADFLADSVDGNVVFYGDGLDQNVKFVKDEGLDGTEFSVDGISCRIKLPGSYNYKNALGAVAVARLLGLSASEIKAGLDKMEGAFGRSEVLHGKYTVVQDCYNANPDSMEKAIELISSLEIREKKVFGLGDMLELGDASCEAHTKTGELCSHSGADAFYFVGAEMKAAYDKLLSDNPSAFAKYYPESSDESIRQIAQDIQKTMPDSTCVLIKGSRGMRLERLTPLLQEES